MYKLCGWWIRWKHEFIKDKQVSFLDFKPLLLSGGVVHIMKEVEQNDIPFWALNICTLFFVIFASFSNTGVKTM